MKCECIEKIEKAMKQKGKKKTPFVRVRIGRYHGMFEVTDKIRKESENEM